MNKIEEPGSMNVQMEINPNINHIGDSEKSAGNAHIQTQTKKKTETAGYSLDIGSMVNKQASHENSFYGKADLKSAEDIASIAGGVNVTVERNYSAIMSNSMSHEDYAQLTKDGVNPTKTTVEESVTNLDKIKLTLAEAGITIEGYNDNLSQKDIEAGGDSLSAKSRIEQAIKKADLPNTKENIEAASEALSQAMELVTPSDDAVKYMINNKLEPTIDNVYMAEHSSLNDNMATQISSLGSFTYSGGGENPGNWAELKPQVEKIVEAMDLSDTDKGLETAKWMLRNDLPVTVDNLKLYERIDEANYPLSEDKVIKSITNAISEGRNPKDALLTDEDNLYSKAVRIKLDFDNMPEPEDITKRRQLEEIRLTMTTEANLTLLRKGISIETEPLEKLVDELKEAERQFYRPLFEDTYNSENIKSNEDFDLDARIDLYKSSMALVREIPNIPAKSLADLVFDNSQPFTLTNLDIRASINKASYERAGESYEALMTAPRSDMGDSIRKAFQNVDDILEDLDFELNDTNRKAVRTLGYSAVEINRDNIEKIREAGQAVNRLINLMTPARVIKLIKEGDNPINDNIYDLEKKLSSDEIKESNERYSKFLFELEKRGEVTEDEKSAYIGMYRLLNQLEKQDGRVISDVLFNGQELTMANMLKAARSNKHKNMDIKIDDDFGGLEEIVKKGESITDQLDKVFVSLISEKPSDEYIEDRITDIRRALKQTDAVGKLLEDIKEPQTIENIMALSDMIGQGPKALRKLFSSDADDATRNKQPGALKNTQLKATANSQINSDKDSNLVDEDVTNLLEKFEDKESSQSAYEKYLEKAIEIAEKRLENADKYIDVKDLTLTARQLSLGRSLANREAYDIPLKTKDGYTSLHLVIEHSDEESKRVRASFESEEYGKVNADFRLMADGLEGLLVTDSRSGEENLKAVSERLKEAFAAAGEDMVNLSIVFSRKSQAGDFVKNNNDENVSTNRLYRIAKAFIKTIM